MPAPDTLAPALDRCLREAQADRLPSVAAAVLRDGGVIWASAVGKADLDAGIEATPEHQFRVGSITKTFTAVAVMQLRDAGALDLDDRLDEHLPGIANGAATIRRLLSHLSGLQREAGDMWAGEPAPSIDELLAAMARYETVLPPARAHHYSNLAFGLLGEVVARRSGIPYTTYVDERLLAPLGLSRTTWQEQAPAAEGYLVDEYAGTVATEPHTDMAGIASMGQLWSTVGDLCAWGAFLAAGRDGVLARDTLEEMWFPQVMLDPDDWTAGWGLGLLLISRNGRVYGGHGGAMPGFLAGLMVNRKTGVGAAALTNSSTRGAMAKLAIDLAEQTVELDPPAPEVWHPEEPPPPEIVPLLGLWWSEGEAFVFRWRDGKLQADSSGAPPWIKPAVFEQTGEREFRVVSGQERGERLRVEEDRLVWGGYPFTRDQRGT